MFPTRRKLLAAFAGLAILLLGGGNAHASFVLTLQQDADPLTLKTMANPSSAGPTTYSGFVGDFLIGISMGNSTSPGGLVNSVAQVATISITNTSTVTHTLHIGATAQGFTSPNSPPPLNVLDTVSGSLVSGTLSGDFQGFADATNTPFGTGFAGQLLTIPTMSGLSLSFSFNGAVSGFSPDGATYSMSLFENLTLSGGGSITLTGGNVQTVATPAPAGLVLFLSGVPIFGFGAWLRRRRTLTADLESKV